APAPLLALILFFNTDAFADSVFLRGGERLNGKIIAEEPTKIIFESQNLGKIEIPRDRIERLEREPVTPSPAAPPGSPAKVFPPASTNATATLVVPAMALTNGFFPWLLAQSLAESNRFDWIQLKSGEWLKGKIKSMQDEKLEFNSEEMDLHDFKWEEIRTLYSPRLKSVRFDTRGNSSGWLLITTNEVRVFSETATNTYPRRELLAITPTGNKELNNWSGKLIAGLTFRSGNTKEIEYNAHGTIERRTPSTRLTLDYLGNFSEINGTQTEDNQRATGNFDYFLSRRLFLRVPFVEYYRDPFQNLDQRPTVGGGVGYDLVHNRRVEWEVSAGPAFQRNWYSSVETNQSQTAEAVALTLGSRFDWEVTKRIDFILEFRGQFSDRETGNNSLHNVATLEFEIHKRLNLDISFIWDRIGSPKTESNGTTPFTDDFRLTLGVGIDF
ncbi:MAG TPA: DUF481 domain-containing protein, partial [Candidatus Eisenbacteria bacterium]|nr:DUF481 domain-containing protein [Candidatus Eisenbacteria bacterium]